MNLCTAFRSTVARQLEKAPEAIALQTHDGSRRYTWKQYADQALKVARGLAKRGVKRGDTVALLVGNHPEMFIADVAIQLLGATPVSIYTTLAPDQLTAVFDNADCRFAIADNELRKNLEHLDLVGLFDSGLAELTEGGMDFERRDPEPSDLATIIYTSGTTGDPKGVELTHAQVLAQVAALRERLALGEEDRTISFLPSAHIADRAACLYAGIVYGVRVATVRERADLAAALKLIRPTYIAAVPRVWEKLKAAIEIGMPNVTDRSVILKGLGLDAARLLITAAAPIDIEVLKYFDKLGAPLCEVWGMSEVAGAGTINPPHALELGSVGTVLSGGEVKLAHDHELLIRGPWIMKGYRKRPDLTAETIDADGWLHTGDVATIDANGYVKIVDRKKELIINSGGKNMSPSHIENTIKAQNLLIGSVVCFGDRRPYNVALIVLDAETALMWGKANGVNRLAADALVANEQIRAAIAAAVAEGNERLSRTEQVKRYLLLPRYWLPGGDELTPTAKLKRLAIYAKYAAQIEALYAPS